MFDAALTALEASALAEGLRASQYAYPLVNAAHILALAALFGSILALDLRLLGLFQAVPVAPLARCCRVSPPLDLRWRSQPALPYSPFSPSTTSSIRCFR